MAHVPHRVILFLSLVLSASLVLAIPVTSGLGEKSDIEEEQSRIYNPTSKELNDDESDVGRPAHLSDKFSKSQTSETGKPKPHWNPRAWILRALSQMKRGKPAFNPTGWRRKKRSVDDFAGENSPPTALSDGGKYVQLERLYGKMKDILQKHEVLQELKEKLEVYAPKLGGGRAKKDAYYKHGSWWKNRDVITRNNGRIVQRQGPNFNPTGW